jgi:hypothetical protein
MKKSNSNFGEASPKNNSYLQKSRSHSKVMKEEEEK